MAHAHLPHLALVHRRRTPHLHTLGIHRRAQQRHHVFPAHRAADAPYRRVDHRQGGTVALAPDQPLGAGGHQLAVLGHQPARGLEIQHGAIQGAGAALDHAQYQAGPGTCRQSGQCVGFGARHIDSVGKVAGKGFAPFGQAIAQLSAETLAFGVAAEQCFGHHHQLRAAAQDLVLVGKDLRQGLGLAARQGTDLQGCHGRNRHHDHSR